MKKFLSLVCAVFMTVMMFGQSYGILVNGHTYFAGESAGENDGYTQYLAHVQINAGDYCQLYDAENDAAWVVPLDTWSEEGFTLNNDRYEASVSGCYDFYIKLKYGSDQLYIGNGSNCGEGQEIGGGEEPDWTNPYTLTFTYFDKTTGDGSAKLSTVEAIFDAASQAYVSAVNTGTHVYAGRKYKEGNDSIFSNLKLGSSSAAGELKFTLAYPTEVDSIVFRAAMYADNEGGDGFSVNGEAYTLSAGKLIFEDKVWKPEGEVSTIDIMQTKASKGRFFLTSIAVYPKNDEEQGGDDPQPEPVLTNGYYLVGNFGGEASWAPAAERLFVANGEAEGEFVLAGITLAADDSLKVVYVENDAVMTWFPGGDNYVVDANHAGEKDIYFRPDYQGGEGWFAGCIYIAANVEPQPVDPVGLFLIGNAPEMASWNIENALPMDGDSIVLNLAEGGYAFKIVPTKAWNQLGQLDCYAIAEGQDKLSCDESYNICFIMPSAAEVTIKVIENQVYVLGIPDGEYIIPSTHYLIGNIAEMGAWNLENAVFMEGDSLQLTLAADTILFKIVTTKAWDQPGQLDCSNLAEGQANVGCEGIYLDQKNVMFILKEEATITIKVIEDQIYVFGIPEEPQPEPVLANGYYLVGDFGGEASWAPAAERLFVANGEAEGEFVLAGITLAADDSLKVVYVENDAIMTWFPGGDNYVVDANHAGEKDIYFRPDYEGGEDWYAGCIYIAANVEPQPEPVDSTTVYFVNLPEWTNVYAYVWNNEKLDNFGVWPGNPMTLTETVFNEKEVYSFTFPSYFDKIIFNNGKEGSDPDKQQTSDKDVIEATPYFYDGIWYASLEDINPEAQTAFFISGDVALVGVGSIWDPQAIKSLENSYTLHLAEGWYQLKISLDGTTDTWKGFSDLTNVAEGLTGNTETNAICFSLAQESDVTVTYQVVEEQVTFTVTGNFFTIADGYYLYGSNHWTLFELTEADKFVANPEVEGEYLLPVTLDVNEEINVVEVAGNRYVNWFLTNGSYIVDDHHNGATTIYFRPDYQGGENWYEGCIYVVPTSTTDINNVNADVETTKILRNGQLLIIKGGKTYTIMGQVVK